MPNPRRSSRARPLVAGVILAGAWLVATSQPMAQSHAPGLATVQAITRTALPTGDRITIELSREVSYKSDRLPDPDRLFFDVASSVVTKQTSSRAQALNGTWLKTLRVGQHTDTSMRIVFELTGTPHCTVTTQSNPYRLVIDLERPAATDTPTVVVAALPLNDPTTRAAAQPIPAAPASADTSTLPAPAPKADPGTPGAIKARVTTDLPAPLAASRGVAIPAPPANTAHGDYSLARQLGLGISRIVIDPGHGGHDPGAQANGIDEAELVLDVALRLDALLKQQPGVETVLTRRTDTFIPLEERTAIANREGADLFLSIHANAMKDPLVRGVETYFLNFATNPVAEAVAARENATSAETMGALPELVKAITLNNKIEESRDLATMVDDSLTRALRGQNKQIKDLGVKQAPFVVLIGAQMPSVLAEISFLTNKAEAGLLKQPAYRQTIAQALCDSLLKYQVTLKRPGSSAAKDKDGQR